MSDRSRQWELPTVLFFGSNRPDSRVVNWYHGPQRRLTGKIPKSFNKHYDTASPAQGSSGEDAALVREEGGQLGARGPEATALGGSCLPCSPPRSLQGPFSSGRTLPQFLPW